MCKAFQIFGSKRTPEVIERVISHGPEDGVCYRTDLLRVIDLKSVLCLTWFWTCPEVQMFYGYPSCVFLSWESSLLQLDFI